MKMYSRYFAEGSTSPPGGNQVDGLPPVCSFPDSAELFSAPLNHLGSVVFSCILLGSRESFSDLLGSRGLLTRRAYISQI